MTSILQGLSQFSYCYLYLICILFSWLLLCLFLFLTFSFQQFGFDILRCSFHSAWGLQTLLDVWVTLRKSGKFSAYISSCFVYPTSSLQSFCISYYTHILLLVTSNKSFSTCSLFVSILFSLCASAYMTSIVLYSYSLIFLLLYSIYY